MRERHRQTATKPTYYIRGIEITAISGLGRIGAGVASPATSSTIIMSSTWASVVPTGVEGAQGLPPPFRRPLCPSSRVGFRADLHEVGRIEGLRLDS